MLGVPLDKRIRRTLAVTVEADLTLDLDYNATGYFPAHLLEPQSDNGLGESNPRDSRSVSRLYWDTTAPALSVSDRVDVDGTTYELISPPRKVNSGRRVVGYSAPCLPTHILYPRIATVHDQGQDGAAATIACNVYGGQEESFQKGDYHIANGEAPVLHWDELAPRNRELRFGGERWKITDATLQHELPAVSLRLRRAG